MKLSRYCLSLTVVLAFSQSVLGSAQTSLASDEAGISIIAITPNEFQRAQDLMNQGQYEQAYDLAESLQTAEAYALAAEALARSVMLGETENLKNTSKLARSQAQNALELDPSLQNARLQYVITDGFVARLTGNVSAWMQKLPQKSFEKIENYRAEFPADVRGDALLGAWHLAIVHKAGHKNARQWFGANLEDGQAFYEKSLAVTPDDPVLLLNYAFALSVLDVEDYDNQDYIIELLKRCAALSPEDDLSTKLIAHALKALDLLDNPDDLRAYAEGFLEGKPVI